MVPRFRAFAAALAVTLVLPASAAAETLVVRWNNAALDAVRATRTPPMRVARALAIAHTCIFDAWAAYDAVAVPVRPGAPDRRPAYEHTPAARDAAISYAAYRCLADQFPTERGRFEALMQALGYDPHDDSTDPSTPAGVGNAAAAVEIDYCHRDGANQLGDLMPGGIPYADYTGYAPVNSPWSVTDVNRWQPLANADGSAQQFLAAHWGRVSPFALTSPSQFRAAAPPAYPHGTYVREVLEIANLSGRLDDRGKAVALYWADGPQTETPPGHWNLFAQRVSARDAHDVPRDVQLFFALNNALLDASIAAWDCKVAYDYVRPITAIRFLLGGRPVRAWAGPGLGIALIDGGDWLPYIPTPPFAEYVSGHSTFSAAAAEVLRAFTGSDVFGASAVVARGSSFVEPGIAPAMDVELTWATFSDAADEAGFSRRLGGIHFRPGDLAGRSIGRQVGAQVWQKAQAHITGVMAGLLTE